MLKQSKTIVLLVILFNVMFSVLFVFSNYYIWDSLKEYPYTTATWSPIMVSYVPRLFENGELISLQTIKEIPNFPFWLFFISTAVNLFFIIILLKSKEAYLEPNSDSLQKPIGGRSHKLQKL